MTHRSAMVCVVDDDADIREALQLILTVEGYDVVLAADGAQALERLLVHKDRCCLILLDLMMPGMNGWEFRRRQLGDPALAAIPVVLLTGADNATRAAKELKVAGAIAKPVDLHTLLTQVALFCGSRCDGR